MKNEYIIKVGGLFITQQYIWSDTVQLTSKQYDATRYDEETLAKATKWLNLYDVKYTLYQVNLIAKVITQIPVEAKQNETV